MKMSLLKCKNISEARDEIYSSEIVRVLRMGSCTTPIFILVEHLQVLANSLKWLTLDSLSGLTNMCSLKTDQSLVLQYFWTYC